MKMTNMEMLERHNMLDAFQVREKEYYEKTGEKLLKGRVKIGYAIEKNKYELRKLLRPYENTFQTLVDEYRDKEAEQEAIKEEQEAAKKEKRDTKNISIIIKDGKSKAEYLEKVKELQEIEIDVDNIRTIDIGEFDGLDLDSLDMRPFLFMIAE